MVIVMLDAAAVSEICVLLFGFLNECVTRI